MVTDDHHEALKEENVPSKKTNRRRIPLKERAQSLGRGLRSISRYLAPLIVLALVAVGVPVAVFLGYMHVVSTPYFSLDDITIRGLHSLDEEDILSQAGVVRGSNAFDVDPQRVKLQLEALPWIRSAQVEKRLPRSLTIQVEERTPSAVLVDGKVFTLLDARGEPFKRIEGGDPVDELLRLPLITGLSRAEAEAPAGQELVLEALEVVRLVEERKLPALSEVHVDPVMGLSIVPAESGIEIRLGRGRYAERLERLRAVFAAIEREARDVDYILIDNEESLNRVTVGSRATERSGDSLKN